MNDLMKLMNMHERAMEEDSDMVMPLDEYEGLDMPELLEDLVAAAYRGAHDYVEFIQALILDRQS